MNAVAYVTPFALSRFEGRAGVLLGFSGSSSAAGVVAGARDARPYLSDATLAHHCGAARVRALPFGRAGRAPLPAALRGSGLGHSALAQWPGCSRAIAETLDSEPCQNQGRSSEQYNYSKSHREIASGGKRQKVSLRNLSDGTSTRRLSAIRRQSWHCRTAREGLSRR